MGTSTLASPPKGTNPTGEVTGGKRVEFDLPLYGDGSETAVAAHGFKLFSEALLEMSTTRPGRRTFDFIASIFVHAFLLGTLLMIPFYFTEALDLTQFTRTLLVAPPPPPPPPPAASAVVKRVVTIKRVFMHAGKLTAPSAIPQKIAMIKEQVLPPDVVEGVVGGVPGGVPGGQMGGVIGGIITGAERASIPAMPRPPAPKAPIRVGGRVKPPRPISTPPPAYPPLAKIGRVQGEVDIDTVIDTDGNVVQMRVLSGPPLLIPAALEALRMWRYEPTYLNEQPVPVSMLVVVRFHLQ